MLLQSIEDKTFAANIKSIAHSLNNTDIDWEQRRYEIAKEMLPHIDAGTAEDAVNKAVEIADALIEKLRKKI